MQIRRNVLQRRLYQQMLQAGDNHALPASSDGPRQQAELTKVAEQLQSNGLMTQDYGGLSEDEQMAYLAADHDVICVNYLYTTTIFPFGKECVVWPFTVA